jgi:UDP-N-acetylmuramoyl-L-alanyl-D-glutamate--2,6-diaminopimelate ligase
MIKKISELVRESGGLVYMAEGEYGDISVSSVEYDSRRVTGGSLFVAVEGFEDDGHRFIKDALEKGCQAVLVSGERVREFMEIAGSGVALLASNNTRKALSFLSAAFYRNPSASLHVTGVTGTNGKTSITYIIESIYSTLGIRCGVIGTVNYRWGGKVIPAPNTTPESKEIHELLRRMLDEGVTHVVMEVSSHALELNRTDDIEFDTVIFTNLTVDHLDFHKSIESYFQTKRRIFELLSRSVKPARAAVINMDDDYVRRIHTEREIYPYEMITFGIDHDALLRADSSSIEDRITGVSYRAIFRGRPVSVSLKLAGRFQVYNSMAALAAAVSAGIAVKDALRGMSVIESVPGRLQVADAGLGFYAVVDYAHTGDALINLLQSVNSMPHNRIITVFGCGGDRDRSKRPVMGRAAVENSDIAIVTSDNPRTEDPDAIIKDVLAGMSGDKFIVEPDREKAIALAVGMAGDGDIIVLAGKGHEDYQITGKTKRHFDDREMALKYMQERKG